MNIPRRLLLILVFSAFTLTIHAQKRTSFKPKIVYQSDELIVTQISANAFQHTSFLQTQDFGNVPCNGLVVRSGTETMVFDTPATEKSTELLIGWLTGTLHCTVRAIIPTHFHNDCLAGLDVFHKNNIPSYAHYKTLELAKANGYPVPQNSFTDSLRLTVGSEYVTAKFFGEGHTVDNVVGYFPAEDILFGGCLIKETGASKGFLGDANLAEWSNTVRKVKSGYPHVKIVIPGHGAYGNKKLLDYTIRLFSKQ